MVRWLLVIFVTLLILIECFLRFVVGLGTPPLTMPHKHIEYMFKPNQDVKRFGNRQLINENGMRSEPLAEWSGKAVTLVLGDSVINGGARLSHEQLSTSILSNTERVFGNVSAGSWGPANLLAWIEEYGYLNADTVIFVLSSHDLTDFPTFRPLNKNTHPQKRPVMAVTEFVERYVVARYWGKIFSKSENSDLINTVSEDTVEGERILKTLITRASDKKTKICLVQHLTQTELQDGMDPNFWKIQSKFEDFGIPVINDKTVLEETIASGVQPYFDDIHLNELGQKILAEKIGKCNQLAVQAKKVRSTDE